MKITSCSLTDNYNNRWIQVVCTLLIINSTIVVCSSRIYAYHTFGRLFLFCHFVNVFVKLCTPPASQVAFFCGKSGLNMYEIWNL
jgi:hypothetical protein